MVAAIQQDARDQKAAENEEEVNAIGERDIQSLEDVRGRQPVLQEHSEAGHAAQSVELLEIGRHPRP